MRLRSLVKSNAHLGFPPQYMDLAFFEPIDVFVDKLQVIGPKHLGHKQVYFHVSKAFTCQPCRYVTGPTRDLCT